MFLAIDESHSNSFTTIGCLCLPLKNLPKYEAEYISKRLEHKIWGEMKWTSLSLSYLNKYENVVESYLKQHDVTFHSWAYRHITKLELKKYWDDDETKMFYCQAYLLLRNVIRKCLNQGCHNNFYIVPDTTGMRGKREYLLTREYLVNDNSIKPKPIIEFCDQGNSQICGALQITDLCTGATRYKYQKETNDTSVSEEFVKFLEKLNSNIPLNYADEKLPDLYKYKMHHCLYIKK